MKIEDYLHLYLGCEVRSLEGGTMTYQLSGIDSKGNALFYDGHGNEMWLSKWKVALRPLSSMTEAEFLEIFNPIQPSDVSDKDLKEAIQTLKKDGFECLDFGGMDARSVFELTRKILKSHFDLF